MNDSPPSSSGPGSDLEQLAGLIADGVRVEWSEIGHVEHDSLRQELLIALQAIEGVATISRGGDTAISDTPKSMYEISRWGQFEVRKPLGHGSFGSVVLARDPMLDRLVALKLYPPHRPDPTSTAAILREGRLLARLRHPNIATVYGVDRQDGRFGMWMEFVNGETLAEAIQRRGCLAPHEAAVIGIELCRALAEVHRMGIIHRDIKAQNVIREQGGRLVLVDFGLGLEERRVDLTTPSGTPLYLAPEVLEGGNPSIASDLYALGVLLYFLVSGRFPVEGSSVDELRTAHADAKPKPIRDVRPDCPIKFTKVLECLLSGDPAKRYRSAGEVEEALADSLSGSNGVSRKWTGWWATAFASGLLAAVAVTSFVIHLSEPEDTADPLRFRGGTSRRLTSTPEWETEPALSPDGSFVAFVSMRSGNADLWLMDAEGGESVRLTSGPAEERRPRWFPDGTKIVFESIRRGEQSIWTVPRLGGTPEFLLEGAGDPAVSPDGRRLAVSLVDDNGARRIGVAELESLDPQARPLTTAVDGFATHRRPAWSPDGTTLCYKDLGNLWLVGADGEDARQLTTDGAGYLAPFWEPSGNAVYASSNREGTTAIWRIPIDGGSLDRVTLGTGFEGEPSLDARGRRLVYATLERNQDIVVVSLERGQSRILSTGAYDVTPAISPDASFVVFSSDRRAGWDLWGVPLAEESQATEPQLMVTSPRALSNPAVSPDGRWIAYQGREGTRRGVFLSRVDGGREIRVSPPQENAVHPTWHPSGDAILFASGPEGSSLLSVPVQDDGAVGDPKLVLEGSVAILRPAVSPDGSWVAFVGGEGDEGEAWIAPLGERRSGVARQLTRSAQIVDLAWLDESCLIASGMWGEGRWELRSIEIAAGSSCQTVNLDFGAAADGGGPFDLASDGSTVVLSRTEPRGDVWIIDSDS